MIELWAHQAMHLSLAQSGLLSLLTVAAFFGLVWIVKGSDENV